MCFDGCRRKGQSQATTVSKNENKLGKRVVDGVEDALSLSPSGFARGLSPLRAPIFFLLGSAPAAGDREGHRYAAFGLTMLAVIIQHN